MATTYIPINTGPRLGQRLRSFVDLLAQVTDQGARLNQIMGTMVDDSVSPPSYAVLESQFGLQAGDGAKVYAAMQALAGLNSTTLNSFLAQCG